MNMNVFIIILMRKSNTKRGKMFSTLRPGLTSFHDIQFDRKSRFYTSQSVNEDGHKSLVEGLNENKRKFQKLKTQVTFIRQEEISSYIMKSSKYQQLLNINDNKKKRLPTLNTKVGQVVKKAVTDTLPRNIQYLVTPLIHRLTTWKPQSREGHSTVPFKNTIVMMGGHCSYPFSTALIYNIDTHAWDRQFPLLSARSYHTTILYKNRFIIVFGGMGSYDVSMKCRVCYNTISLIDMHNYSVRPIKIAAEDRVEPRRSHTAVLMGKYMLVFGGINTKKDYLSDFTYLDLKELKWYEKEYKIEGKELGEYVGTGLAKHKAIGVFKSGRKNYPLYSSDYSETEGILMFGGQFGCGEQNVLLQFNFNKYNPVLKKVEYLGVPPSSMDPLVERLSQNVIVVISGEQSYRELWVYKVKQREFVLLAQKNIADHLGGIGSSICKHDEQMYVFYGVGEKGYISQITSLILEEKVVEHEAVKRNRVKEIAWRQNVQQSSDDEYR